MLVGARWKHLSHRWARIIRACSRLARRPLQLHMGQPLARAVLTSDRHLPLRFDGSRSCPRESLRRPLSIFSYAGVSVRIHGEPDARGQQIV